MNTAPAPVLLGTDGTPAVPDPVATADRTSRLADELAALVAQVRTALVCQHQLLAGVDTTTADGERIVEARRVTRHAVRSLGIVVDSLGETHVACDELAWQLHSLLPAT